MQKTKLTIIRHDDKTSYLAGLCQEFDFYEHKDGNSDIFTDEDTLHSCSASGSYFDTLCCLTDYSGVAEATVYVDEDTEFVLLDDECRLGYLIESLLPTDVVERVQKERGPIKPDTKKKERPLTMFTAVGDGHVECEFDMAEVDSMRTVYRDFDHDDIRITLKDGTVIDCARIEPCRLEQDNIDVAFEAARAQEIRDNVEPVCSCNLQVGHTDDCPWVAWKDRKED